MTVLRLIRGLPGSGKSTLAETLPGIVLSADDFMVDKDDNYCFDPRKLGQVHNECLTSTIMLLSGGHSVCVANTFTELWEMRPYIAIATALDVELEITDLYDGELSDEQLAHRNIHGVPISTIRAMRKRYQKEP